jgi:hypothetical protein
MLVEAVHVHDGYSDGRPQVDGAVGRLSLSLSLSLSLKMFLHRQRSWWSVSALICLPQPGQRFGSGIYEFLVLGAKALALAALSASFSR